MSLRARVQIGWLAAVLVACDRPAPELSSGTAPAPVAAEPAGPGSAAPTDLSPGTAGANAPPWPAAAAPPDLSPGTAGAKAPPRPAADVPTDLSPGTAEPPADAATPDDLSVGAAPSPVDPEVARAPVSLPRGRWESPDEHGRVCLEVRADGVAVLTFFDGESEGWKPIRVTGKLRASARGDEPIVVAFKVESVERKGISVCRKFVVDETLARTRQLGATWGPGASVEFTLAFTADRRRVRLCVPHGERAPTCRELRRVEA